LVQLHEIISQELENKQLVDQDYFLELQKALDTEVVHVLENTQQNIQALERIRKRLTTSRELDALEAAITHMGWGTTVDLRRNNKTIELF